MAARSKASAASKAVTETEVTTDPFLAADEHVSAVTSARWATVRESLTTAGDVTVAASAVFADVKVATAEASSRVTDAAYAVAALVAAGKVGKGADPATPGYMSNVTVAALAGVAPSNVTKWLTLGHALTVVGFDPSTVGYSYLQQKGLAERATVKGAILAAGATVESVLEVVRTYVVTDENGRESVLSEGKRAARIASESDGEVASDAAGSTGSDSADAGTVPMTADGIADALKPMAAAKLALAVLLKVASGLTADEWEAIEGTMHKIVTRETTLRAKAAADAAA